MSSGISSINRSSFHAFVALYVSTIPLGTYKVALSQFLKASSPVSKTSVINEVIDSNPVQPMNAVSPIDFREFGKTIDFRLLQEWNA